MYNQHRQGDYLDDRSDPHAAQMPLSSLHHHMAPDSQNSLLAQPYRGATHHTNTSTNAANNAAAYHANSFQHPDQMMGSYVAQLGTPHLVSSLFLSPPTEESTISTPGTAAVTTPRHSVEMNLRNHNSSAPTPPFLPDYPLYTEDYRYGYHKDKDVAQAGGPRGLSNKPVPTSANANAHNANVPSASDSCNVSPTVQPPRGSRSPSTSPRAPEPEEMAYSSSFSAKSDKPKRVYKKKTLTAHQKLVHNQIERKYRSAINLGLLRLKSLVPWYTLVEDEDARSPETQASIKQELEEYAVYERVPTTTQTGTGHPATDPTGCPYSLDELATLTSKAGILQVTADYVQYLQNELAKAREQ